MTPIKLHRRRISRQGGSHRISIPPEWLESAGLEAGDEVDVLDIGILVVLPKAELREEEMDEAIECLKRAVKVAYRNRMAGERT